MRGRLVTNMMSTHTPSDRLIPCSLHYSIRFNFFFVRLRWLLSDDQISRKTIFWICTRHSINRRWISNVYVDLVWSEWPKWRRRRRRRHTWNCAQSIQMGITCSTAILLNGRSTSIKPTPPRIGSHCQSRSHRTRIRINLLITFMVKIGVYNWIEFEWFDFRRLAVATCDSYFVYTRCPREVSHWAMGIADCTWKWIANISPYNLSISAHACVTFEI